MEDLRNPGGDGRTSRASPLRIFHSLLFFFGFYYFCGKDSVASSVSWYRSLTHSFALLTAFHARLDSAETVAEGDGNSVGLAFVETSFAGLQVSWASEFWTSTRLMFEFTLCSVYAILDC